jgi:hypothetical protein
MFADVVDKPTSGRTFVPALGLGSACGAARKISRLRKK